ncbi:hypothetical protein IVA88_12485 [Bradyrhizobium sp. 149]|uniref:hypothetical protein n=1 Tax=Bradyrhizobium sp. 149 TaxID=2782624 RepID=UPI001FF9A68A|nr:hypothetical protein [Bradyrhizobium sp. 149]MCK1652250.1 hypothetical protein [Bradyrhizobium sp. 149]
MFRRKSGEDAAEHPLPQPETSARRAPAVQEKLDCALGALAELDEQVAEYALEAAERKPGAADKLAGHRAKIEAAKTAADELAAALRLAERLDRQTLAAGAAQMRAEQLAVFEKATASRIDSMSEVLALIGKASAVYARYVNASAEMAAALPTGTHLPAMHFEGYSGHFLGNGEALIGREAFRLASHGAKPPFAKLPSLSAGDNVAALRPGVEILREAHTAVLNSVKAQVERLDAAALDRATRTEAA